MRNPGALNVGEPGSRENLGRRHSNWPPTHFANDPLNPSFRADVHHDRAWWLLEARRVGSSDWPAVLALHAAAVGAWRARHDHPDYGGAP
jgi:hypothetical protein